jgi:hypothetical protein
MAGGSRSFSRCVTALAQILPIAFAMFPDFGTGSPMVASPMTCTRGAFVDS